MYILFSKAVRKETKIIEQIQLKKMKREGLWEITADSR